MSAALSAAELADLLAHARAALPNAYAPYSDFQVAAAVRDDAGRTHVGVNVENVSYGLAVCAERAAIFTAIAAGARRIEAVAVTSRRLRPISPCGACRQVIREFAAEDAPVASEDADGRLLVTLAGALLPGAFMRDALLPGGLAAGAAGAAGAPSANNANSTTSAVGAIGPADPRP
jgi:cytidine deaminase